MNSKKISMSLLAISVITAAGFGLYRLGMSHAASQSPSVGLMEAQAMTVAAPEDPSSWGLPEGERATRRHMESGLKAGDTDPLTDRPDSSIITTPWCRGKSSIPRPSRRSWI